MLFLTIKQIIVSNVNLNADTFNFLINVTKSVSYISMASVAIYH